MLEVIFNLFVLCLSIVGLVEIFRIISMSFLTKKEFSENALLLIPIYEHNAKIEMILRNAITNAKLKNLMKLCNKPQFKRGDLFFGHLFVFVV